MTQRSYCFAKTVSSAKKVNLHCKRAREIHQSYFYGNAPYSLSSAKQIYVASFNEYSMAVWTPTIHQMKGMRAIWPWFDNFSNVVYSPSLRRNSLPSASTDFEVSLESWLLQPHADSLGPWLILCPLGSRRVGWGGPNKGTNEWPLPCPCNLFSILLLSRIWR